MENRASKRAENSLHEGHGLSKEAVFSFHTRAKALDVHLFRLFQ
jgi:hypothetical protein